MLFRPLNFFIILFFCSFAYIYNIPSASADNCGFLYDVDQSHACKGNACRSIELQFKDECFFVKNNSERPIIFEFMKEPPASAKDKFRLGPGKCAPLMLNGCATRETNSRGWNANFDETTDDSVFTLGDGAKKALSDASIVNNTKWCVGSLESGSKTPPHYMPWTFQPNGQVFAESFWHGVWQKGDNGILTIVTINNSNGSTDQFQVEFKSSVEFVAWKNSRPYRWGQRTDKNSC